MELGFDTRVLVIVVLVINEVIHPLTCSIDGCKFSFGWLAFLWVDLGWVVNLHARLSKTPNRFCSSFTA